VAKAEAEAEEAEVLYSCELVVAALSAAKEAEVEAEVEG
jgi:hypothetical protein